MKIAVHAAVAVYTSVEFFLDLDIDNFFEVVEEIKAVSEKNG
jgi:hypothetical protein